MLWSLGALKKGRDTRLVLLLLFWTLVFRSFALEKRMKGMQSTTVSPLCRLVNLPTTRHTETQSGAQLFVMTSLVLKGAHLLHDTQVRSPDTVHTGSVLPLYWCVLWCIQIISIVQTEAALVWPITQSNWGDGVVSARPAVILAHSLLMYGYN